MGLSDFTDTNALGITIAGQAFDQTAGRRRRSCHV
jgi:hypothetical protein